MRGHVAKRSVSAGIVADQKIVGVRELKANASRILRQVRDSRESFILTHRGRAVGVILPLESSAREPALEEDKASAWANFMAAGRQIERRSRRGVNAVQILSSMRR
jgi:prevent-host-death family protein